MPHGLEIFNADGTVAFNSSTRPGRLVATYTTTATTATTNYITVPRVAGETCFAFAMLSGSINVLYGYVDGAGAPDPTGNRLRISTFSAPGPGSVTIFYGVK